MGHDIEHDDVRKKGSGVLCDLSTKTAISMRVWPPVESSTLSSTEVPSTVEVDGSLKKIMYILPTGSFS